MVAINCPNQVLMQMQTFWHFGRAGNGLIEAIAVGMI
jgi:hypothetical protein